MCIKSKNKLLKINHVLCVLGVSLSQPLRHKKISRRKGNAKSDARVSLSVFSFLLLINITLSLLMHQYINFFSPFFGRVTEEMFEKSDKLRFQMCIIKQ
jgi:hypothetical protein